MQIATHMRDIGPWNRQVLLVLTILTFAACNARDTRPRSNDERHSLGPAPSFVQPAVRRQGLVRVRVLDAATVPDWEDSVLNDDIVVHRVWSFRRCERGGATSTFGSVRTGRCASVTPILTTHAG